MICLQFISNGELPSYLRGESCFFAERVELSPPRTPNRELAAPMPQSGIARCSAACEFKSLTVINTSIFVHFQTKIHLSWNEKKTNDLLRFHRSANGTAYLFDLDCLHMKITKFEASLNIHYYLISHKFLSFQISSFCVWLIVE